MYLFEPKQSVLKIDEEYFFKVYAVALKVALVDSSKSWIYFEKSSEEENIWTLKFKPVADGQMTLYAKVDENKSFSGAFQYSVSK